MEDRKKDKPIFDPDDYETWQTAMISHLSAKGLYGAIDNHSDDWANLNHQQRTTKRHKAYDMILGSMTP